MYGPEPSIINPEMRAYYVYTMVNDSQSDD